MQTKTANKGEWAEFYTFLKILSHPSVLEANKNLKSEESKSYYLFTEILRDRSSYKIKNDDILIKCENVSSKVPSDFIGQSLDRIFKNIMHGTRTFSIPCAAPIMERLGGSKIKASSSQKADLEAKFQYNNLPITPHFIGFSIKSFLGGAATLLNTSKATNTVYKVQDISHDDMYKINAIRGVKDKVKKNL